MDDQVRANPGERHERPAERQASAERASGWAGWTRIGLVVDRSGSMKSILDEANGGLRHWLRSVQDAPGADRTSLDVLFFDTAFDYASYEQVRFCDSVVVEPRGGTALFDATAMMVTRLGKRLGLEDRALLIVMTDGGENSSKEFDIMRGGQERITALLDERERSGRWTVVFLARSLADAGAWALHAARRGSSLPGAMASGEAVTKAMAQTSNSTVSYMASGVGSRGELAGGPGFFAPREGAAGEPEVPSEVKGESGAESEG